jgi:hypothetical protein
MTRYRDRGHRADQEIGFVHDGEEAVIKLDVFPFTRYGTVPGKIKTVSEDAIASGNPLPLTMCGCVAVGPKIRTAFGVDQTS